MDEYIEKQAALDIVNGWRNQLIPTYGENDEYVKCLEMVAEHLELLHVADVRPVRRGRWVDENIYKQTMSGKTYDGFTYCSNCKHDFSFGYRSKFCPDCGSYNCADMRGGDAE